MQRCVVALSSSSDGETAVAEVVKKLNSQSEKPKLIIFSSNTEMFWYCSDALKKIYSDTTLVGTTSYVNFGTDSYSHDGLCAMALYEDIECSAGVLFDVDRHPSNYMVHVKNALEKLSSYENTCCLEFTNAFTNGEELVIDTLEYCLKDLNIPIIGGSAGNSTGNSETIVSLNGEIYKNTCVFVFIKNLKGKVYVTRENLYKPTKHILTATDVDCEERMVYEYNGKPAADIMAELLNTTLDELPGILSKHPVGRIVGKDIYISESGEIMPDGAITYYSRIYNQTKVALLEVDDMYAVWKRTAQEIKNVIPEASFAITVNCSSRSKYFEEENTFKDFNDFLKQEYGTFWGMSGYGEQISYNHMNQTMIIVVFE